MGENGPLQCSRVRPAEPGDTDTVLDILRRTIKESCVADHQNDAATLERWLRNKTPAAFLARLERADLSVMVAENTNGVCGVGCVSRAGEIGPLYVYPESQGAGVGGALMIALESQAREWSLTRLSVSSTKGACCFYEKHGFISTGEPFAGYGVTLCYPYEKSLQA